MNDDIGNCTEHMKILIIEHTSSIFDTAIDKGYAFWVQSEILCILLNVNKSKFFTLKFRLSFY